MSPLTIEASLLRALHAPGSASPDANNRRFRVICLILSEGRLCNSISARGRVFLVNECLRGVRDHYRPRTRPKLHARKTKFPEAIQFDLGRPVPPRKNIVVVHSA